MSQNQQDDDYYNPDTTKSDEDQKEDIQSLDPPNLRQRICYYIVVGVMKLFMVDYFDLYYRNSISWNDYKGRYTAKVSKVEDMKRGWIRSRKDLIEKSAKDIDPIAHCMWLVMREDDTYNPDLVIKGQSEKGYTHSKIEVEGQPSDTQRQERKRELLEAVDEQGFVDEVLED